MLPLIAVEWIKDGDRDERAWVGRMAEASAQKLGAAGLIVSSVIKNGDPKRVLVDEGEQWGADSSSERGDCGSSNGFWSAACRQRLRRERIARSRLCAQRTSLMNSSGEESENGLACIHYDIWRDLSGRDGR